MASVKVQIQPDCTIISRDFSVKVILAFEKTFEQQAQLKKWLLSDPDVQVQVILGEST